MAIDQVANLEQTLNRACKASAFLHSTEILILAFLLRVEPIGYKKMGLILSMLVFVASIFISRSLFLC